MREPKVHAAKPGDQKALCGKPADSRWTVRGNFKRKVTCKKCRSLL